MHDVMVIKTEKKQIKKMKNKIEKAIFKQNQEKRIGIQ